ncbi:MAG TPA: NAD-dependent epimerase/dehydratase family protein [Gemmatimonadales bacterium]|nr:NAD-dependent epimerase/dehydratase family protein [Gemmatimonadales bacterium]
MTRVLLTGAAGFIGSHVAEGLVARGDEVVGLDNFDAFYPRAIKEANVAALRRGPRFRLVEGDIRDATAVAALVTPETVVVHLAARAGVRPSLEEPALYASVNIEGTAVLLEAARRAGARRVVFGSSSSVYGDTAPVPFSEDWPALLPISPYAATKRAGELLCATFAQLYDLRIIALRFFTVYGPRQRPDLAIHKFTRLIAAGQPVPFYGDGSSERDYTYIDDIVGGVIAAVDWTRGPQGALEIVNLGESRTTRLDALVALIARAVGKEARLERLPAQPGDVRRTCADVRKAARVLGYRPTTVVEDGIPRFVRWFEETHGHPA